jgi:hypothetical protein
MNPTETSPRNHFERSNTPNITAFYGQVDLKASEFLPEI